MIYPYRVQFVFICYAAILLSACSSKYYIPTYDARMSAPSFEDKFKKELEVGMRSNDITKQSEIHKRLSNLPGELYDAPKAYLGELIKLEASPQTIQQKIRELERKIMDDICEKGSTRSLIPLYENFPNWLEKSARDSFRRALVNEAINPWLEKKCGRGIDKSSNIEKKTFYCEYMMTGVHRQNITYEDATLLISKFSRFVDPLNYPHLWQLRYEIWEIFKSSHTYSDMDRFKADHPKNPIASDRSFDNVKDTFRLNRLLPLLTLYRNNPGTIFERDICLQISHLASKEGVEKLDSQSRSQIRDICKITELEARLSGCMEEFIEAEELLKDLRALLEKYPDHDMAFNLVHDAVGFFFNHGQIASARKIIEEFAPRYHDTSNKQQEWFKGIIKLLENINADTLERPEYMGEWNTIDMDEFGLVSWGNGLEVFFVRRDPTTMRGKIMTSIFKNGVWTQPTEVATLSTLADIEPLYIDTDGRVMLLRSGKELLQSDRWSAGKPWSRPYPAQIPQLNKSIRDKMSGFVTATPGGSAILFESYQAVPIPDFEPKKDIFFVEMKDGGDSKPKSLSKTLGITGDYGKPVMTLDGRMLFFTSNQPGGFGNTDMYSAKLGAAYDWSTLQEPVNIGVPMNTIYSDEGITFFSEHSGESFFSRIDRCRGGKLDIWKMKVINTPKVFSENTMRFVGVVMDQDGKEISNKGFMEFSFGQDSLTGIEYKNIEEKGTYQYTGPDSVKVIRLFPEVPGYYSERDTLHFLSNSKGLGIIRDTFIVYDFDYIRKNFKLEHSTFFTGKAEFDNPDKTYPELVRLAKIATRMSAQLYLLGHTDNTGEGGSNMELSLQRANAVKAFLVKRCGFPEDRVKTLGVGSTKPLCYDDSEWCRQRNRRVEVMFLMPNLIDGK